MTHEAVVPGPVAGPPLPPPGKAAAGRGRSPGSRRHRLAFLAAGLVLLVGAATGGLVVTGTSPAAAAGNRHFVLIATHGAPLWDAKAWLYDGHGNLVYKWSTGGKSGGRALWYFTNGGDGGHIYVKMGTVGWSNLLLDRDHCFLVQEFGHTRYTGDSVTGGCTPD